MASSRLTGVPAQVLVLVSIISVQVGAAIGRSVFDEIGAAGVTLLRVGIAAVVLLVALSPALRSWSRASWRAAIGSKNMLI